MYKELIPLNGKKKKKTQKNIQLKKSAEGLKRHFSKEDVQMTNRYMNMCSTGKCKSDLLEALSPLVLRGECWLGCGEKRTLSAH